jgi:carbamoyl-phosphate synthase large subunit
VDMASTGEVGCIGDDAAESMLKSMLSVGYRVPEKAILISSGTTKTKYELLEASKLLVEKGYKIYATGGSQAYLADHGIPATVVAWPHEPCENNVLNLLRNKEVDLVINIPKDQSEGELANDYAVRRNAVDFNIPLITNARLATAFIQAFCKMSMDEIQIKSWQEYN